jgi:hypothetical protein
MIVQRKILRKPDVSSWHEAAERRRAENVRSARVIQTSICSAIAMASSTSMPRYLTVLEAHLEGGAWACQSSPVLRARLDQREF